MIPVETAAEREKLVLFAVTKGEPADNELAELESLVESAGGECVGVLLQRLEKANSVTYLGSGKLLELKTLAEELGATGVVCDDELSPVQQKNLEDVLNVCVLDRTMVILDIFAARANTSEGRLQVELAQLKYRATRLTGHGRAMSRQGGGIGSRGPGEKKLETDRRRIHERISHLKAELKDVASHRERLSAGRNGMSLSAALVGYTNAGKSSLLNALTGSDVFARDILFATLDTATRAMPLKDGGDIFLTDTVGFVDKLPHHLIEAFRGTLTKALSCDIIIHVVDGADEHAAMHMHVVYETLKNLGTDGKTVITVFNKCDKDGFAADLRDPKADHRLCVSTVTGEGLPELRLLLARLFREQKIYLERVFPYSQAGDIAIIRKHGQLLSEEYREDGIYIKAYVPKSLYPVLSGL